MTRILKSRRLLALLALAIVLAALLVLSDESITSRFSYKLF